MNWSPCLPTLLRAGHLPEWSTFRQGSRLVCGIIVFCYLHATVAVFIVIARSGHEFYIRKNPGSRSGGRSGRSRHGDGPQLLLHPRQHGYQRHSNGCRYHRAEPGFATHCRVRSASGSADIAISGDDSRPVRRSRRPTTPPAGPTPTTKTTSITSRTSNSVT